jgi:branched-chain amino acid transport system substrate-binding protein
VSQTPAVMDHNDVKVGASVSISGKYRLQGQQALNGLLPWQSHTNAQGGIPVGGAIRPVRLTWYDDESRSGRASKNVLRLLHDDRVDILLGPYSSNLTLAAAELAEEKRKLLWNYGGTSDEIFSRGWKYVVGISSPASDYFRNLPAWLARQHPDLRRICVLYSGKGNFGRQVSRGIVESAQETSYSVHSVPLNDLSNADLVLSILRECNPEVLVVSGNLQGELALFQTRSCWPKTVHIVAAVSAGIPVFGSLLGHMSEHVIGASQWEPGLSVSPTIGPTSEWFVNAFNKKFGITPDYVSAGAFAAVLIVAECIRQVGSVDDDALRSAASGLSCSTLYGRFRIDPKIGTQIGHRIILVRWQNYTKRVLLGPD